MITITAFYAGLLALLFVSLSLRVIATRRATKVTIGDGESPELRRAMRVQANCAEYVPITLVLLAGIELAGFSSWYVHLLGLAFLVSRVVHAYGVSQSPENLTFRVCGMLGTFGTIVIAALTNILHALSSWSTSY